MERLIPIVETLRKNPDYEFEFRLGKLEDSKFVSGVSAEYFNEIEHDCIACTELSNPEIWVEEMDIFYTHGKRRLRTRVTYPTDTLKVTSQTIVKKKIETCDIKIDAPYDGRVCLSCETILNPGEIPVIVQPEWVRLKQVKHFVMHDNAGTPIWSFELSKTWSAPTRSEAETLQNEELPVYEVECELKDKNKYINTHTNEYISKSTVMKLQGMIGFPNATIFSE